MKNEWVKVFITRDFYRAELVRQFLIDNDIEAVLLNKQGFPYNIGEVEVHVHSSAMEKATDLIKGQDL